MKLFERKMELVGISNEFIVLQNEWLKIPYGIYPHSRGLQYFGKEEAITLVNSLEEMKKRKNFGGLPVYVGHPDSVDFSDKHKDFKAYGWIEELAANENDFGMRIKWSEQGNELISNAHYKYFSPHWLTIVKNDGKGNKILRPVVLKSLGLTNEPCIPVMPVACEDLKKGGEAVTLFEKLIEFLGLSPEQTEDDVFALVQKIVDENKSMTQLIQEEAKINEVPVEPAPNESSSITLKNIFAKISGKLEAAANEIPEATANELLAEKEKITGLESSLATANEALNQSQQAHAALLINVALTEGKLVPAQKDEWVGKFKNNFETTANELQVLKPSIHNQSVFKAGELAKLNVENRSKMDQLVSAANEKAKEMNISFEDAFIALRKDEKYSALFV